MAKKKTITIIKLHLFLLSLFSLSLSLLIHISTLQFKTHHPSVFFNQLQLQHIPHIKNFNHLSNSPPFDYLKEKLKEKVIKIGLVNMHVLEEVEEWKSLGTRTTMVHFDSVPKDRRWGDYFPEWIDEDEKWNAPKCPDIPMPHFKNYGKFNLIVVKVPCGNDHPVKGQGVRDVFRLQVNLVVANLVVNNGDDDQNVFIVFIGSCGPMIEIFRCDDLVRHEGEFWIYKPDLRRLKQKVIMPVGSCQLAVSDHKKQGEGKVTYDFSKLSNTIDHPKEAYVTILHSSEAYVCGAIVLAQSIIQSNSTKDLVLLADKSIRKKSRQALKAAGWKIKIIARIRSPYAKRGAYNEWNYSKLRIWQLTAYDKIIFIDSDLIILKNIDKFFVYPQLSAIGNDKLLFNSGIMLVEPSVCVFNRLMKEMYTLISYNHGDQGFLNEAFTWWHRWPRRLNFLKIFKGVSNKQHKVPTSVYSMHYLGLKPWMCYKDYDCNWDMLDHNCYASDSAHWRWWQVYDAMPKKLHSFCSLSKSMDARIKKWRRRAENASLPDRHYKIKVKDPRQHNCKGTSCDSVTYTQAGS